MRPCAHEPIRIYLCKIVAQAFKGTLQLGVEVAEGLVHAQHVTVLPVEDEGEMLGGVADEGQL